MGKTLLLLSGAQAAIAQALREKGHALAVMDADPQAPAFAFADSCLIADVYGPMETAAAAERYSRKIRKIDGVICVAADAPVTAATVAQRLRLPGLLVHIAELFGALLPVTNYKIIKAPLPDMALLQNRPPKTSIRKATSFAEPLQ